MRVGRSTHSWMFSRLRANRLLSFRINTQHVAVNVILIVDETRMTIGGCTTTRSRNTYPIRILKKRACHRLWSIVSALSRLDVWLTLAGCPANSETHDTKYGIDFLPVISQAGAEENMPNDRDCVHSDAHRGLFRARIPYCPMDGMARMVVARNRDRRPI